MQESVRRAVEFLEREIQTYRALSLFLSKRDVKKHVPSTEVRALSSPYYKTRMREAIKLVSELKNST